MNKTPDKYLKFCICSAIVLAICITYAPVVNCDFVGLDDIIYVTDNEHVKDGITTDSVRWGFTNKISYFQPLAWLSHMADCQLYGLKPAMHHLSSLIIHIANAVLLFILLQKMTGSIWPSAFVAALFAFHPVNVDSVAWISERKNVLSAFFLMLTILAYTSYAQRPGIGKYLLVVLAFCIGSIAKPMLATLPFALLLFDYWPLGRLEFKQLGLCRYKGTGRSATTYQQRPVSKLILEKLPLIVISVGLIIFSSWLLNQAGEVISTDLVPMRLRIANALVSYVKYVGKMFWPGNLAIFYPFPRSIPAWQMIGALMLLVIISLVAIKLLRKIPSLAVGWFWYLGTLLPVIGLMQAGVWPEMSDRFAYVPYIGLFISIAWALPELLPKTSFRKITMPILAAITIAALMICTRMQLRYWQNSLTLYKHTLEVTQNNYFIHNNYGGALLKTGQVDAAILQFEESLRINPSNLKALNNMGAAYLKQGKIDEAMTFFNRGLVIRKDSPETYFYLGVAYAGLGKYDLAVKNWNKAIEFQPDHLNSINNLAWVLGTCPDSTIRNSSKAVMFAQQAADLTKHRNPSTLDTLAAAYAAEGKFELAVKTAKRAIDLAQANKSYDLVNEIEKRLQLYTQKKPYWDPAIK